MSLSGCTSFLEKPIVHHTLSGTVIGGAALGGCALAACAAGGGMASALVIGGIAAAAILALSLASGVWGECSSDGKILEDYLAFAQPTAGGVAGIIPITVGASVGMLPATGGASIIPVLFVTGAVCAVLAWNQQCKY